jgi:excisionase family DNA binding protein
MVQEPQPLLTVDEVAELLKVSRATVRRLAYRGELSFLRIGRAIRFERAALSMFIEKARQPRLSVAPRVSPGKVVFFDRSSPARRKTRKFRGLG